MDALEEETFQYINEKLFTEERPVLFTDLIFLFKIGPSRSKKIMYSYYKQNTVTNFNCIIVTCQKNGIIKVVSDVNNPGDENSITDCFIYAFNPMEKFIPVNRLVDQRDCLSIKNPHKLHVAKHRSKTLEEKATPKVTVPLSRSKTVPDEGDTRAKVGDIDTKGTKVKKAINAAKGNGLRSTAILAKMRAERENKEAQ